MRVAGMLHPADRHIIGQAFVVARIADRVRQRIALESRRNAERLLEARHAGHVCHQPGERRDLLIETIRGSLSRKRITVVIHSMKNNASMLRFLHGKRLPEEQVSENESLLLVPAHNVWPSRRPDPVMTLELVDELHALGNRLGHREVQLISDANHSFIQGRSCDAVVALEEWWNRARLEDLRLACLYRAADLPPIELATIQRLHSEPKP